MASTTPTCRDCGGPKPRGRGRVLCDECRVYAARRGRDTNRAAQRRYYERNRDEVIARAQARAAADPEGIAAYKRDNYKQRCTDGTVLRIRVAKYGLTVEDFGKLLASQGGVCAICAGTDEQRRLSVDHDHETGEVRGLLCSGCNGAKLGRLGDDPERAEARAEHHEQRAAALRAAAEYLRNPPARAVLGVEQP